LTRHIPARESFHFKKDELHRSRREENAVQVFRRLLMEVSLVVVALLTAHAAVAQDWLLNGGKFSRAAQVSSHSAVTARDEAGAGQTNRVRACCEAQGGVFQTDGSCLGTTPHDDGNIVQRSIP
jgi:hypothetical protein